MKNLTCFLFIFIFLSGFSQLKGHALVTFTKGQKTHQFENAVVIKNIDCAQFEALDDFGNTLAFVTTTKNSKHLLNLPLNLKELTSFLLYRIPSTCVNCTVIKSKEGDLIQLEKKIGNKKLIVHFGDFKKTPLGKYPQKIEINYKKKYLKITWQMVSVQ
ncbi:MAG: hypothetical protein A3G32_06265 [Deltaproteobacteria bacterium RIFCSPLOWO2_12_FULL_40_28]|nr:MAG: hypothetical protein A3C45_02360 [Deltaproteobacteria bacterium RIFCSPHIGHO2_02_FULL_40_28]OGQ19059.1 MAG: hypothetical protein A3E27_05450 [Deltaproteobacteria bacterium RIFCSPHIGHO2_12_FULL_40_32]OGQ40231.1 MAG: hypothetical protein A3I69_00890 [Deltaproteobacteria bacterium RIFCSPLOWO2_02_FULL_40_36]OGQ53502.1 MAG: hypothetical protein A3G32_06265 [Deltaproteobacteria bacterium RIFCSPLOWO2_12_FULL_40_28]